MGAPTQYADTPEMEQANLHTEQEEIVKKQTISIISERSGVSIEDVEKVYKVVEELFYEEMGSVKDVAEEMFDEKSKTTEE